MSAIVDDHDDHDDQEQLDRLDQPDYRTHWLHLILTPGLGAARIFSLLRRFGLPENILSSSLEVLSLELGPDLARRLKAENPQRRAAIDLNLNWSRKPNHHLLALGDDLYPGALLHLTDPPPLLWAIGNLDLLTKPAVGIVGSRHATRGGINHAREFARSLGDANRTIISGMARGIDAAAHEGGLQSGSSTIAVLAHGLEKMYPASNRALGLSIAAKGLLLSEFGIGSLPLRDHFPRRNRLIAALSEGVLVVEAARHSGSLITARLAADLGRDVYAVPGSIDSPLSKGCHHLIKQGAKLIDCAADILNELSPSGLAFASPVLSRDERKNRAVCNQEATFDPVLNSLGWDPASVDELSSRGDLAIADLNAQLIMLELAGKVERLADGRFRRLASA